MISAVSEWLAALTLGAFSFTYTTDFMDLRVTIVTEALALRADEVVVVAAVVVVVQGFFNDAI